MSAKITTQKGPSNFEIGLAAALSVILGVALGAVYLVTRPVLKVKEIPKDAPANAVYYIEGVRDSDKATETAAKRKAFTEGESVEIGEGELNVFLGSLDRPAGAPPAKPGDKAPAQDPKFVEIGGLNGRIHEGKIQISDTVTFNAFGVAYPVIVQAVGVLEKHASGFDFDPQVFYVGGCPLQRIPFVRDWVLKKLLYSQPVPQDIAAAWPKVTEIAIDGSTLRLKMP